MSSLSVEGIYENGKVTLLETPSGVDKARVRVTFLPESEQAEEGSDGQRDVALRRMMEFMRRGVDFGGERFDREELFGERQGRLEERRG
jgi:hypothetical protein